MTTFLGIPIFAASFYVEYVVIYAFLLPREHESEGNIDRKLDQVPSHQSSRLASSERQKTFGESGFRKV